MRRLLWGSGIAAVFMAVACGSGGTSQDVGTAALTDGGEAGPSGIIGGGGGLCKPRSANKRKRTAARLQMAAETSSSAAPVRAPNLWRWWDPQRLRRRQIELHAQDVR